MTKTNVQPFRAGHLLFERIKFCIDVYKRQVYLGCKFDGNIDTIINIAKEKKFDVYKFRQQSHTYGSVSYTHLDVYKRQEYLCTASLRVMSDVGKILAVEIRQT